MDLGRHLGRILEGLGGLSGGGHSKFHRLGTSQQKRRTWKGALGKQNLLALCCGVRILQDTTSRLDVVEGCLHIWVVQLTWGRILSCHQQSLLLLLHHGFIFCLLLVDHSHNTVRHGSFSFILCHVAFLLWTLGLHNAFQMFAQLVALHTFCEREVVLVDHVLQELHQHTWSQANLC